MHLGRRWILDGALGNGRAVSTALQRGAWTAGMVAAQRVENCVGELHWRQWYGTGSSENRGLEPLHDTGDEQMTAHCEEDLSPGLYVVATPIGNIEDMSSRAMRVLRSASLIACEDTRTTKSLLRHARVSPRREARLVSYTEHSHSKSSAKVETIIREAASSPVALVSEAGTPCIADPGARLIELCHSNSIPLFSIPGACSVVSALSLSGFPSDRFSFEGFLPSHRNARRAVLHAIKEEKKTTVVFESPHRIMDTLETCVEVFGEREACLVREMTKRHEQCVRGPFSRILRTMIETFSSLSPGKSKGKKKAKEKPVAKGEIVIVIGGASQSTTEEVTPHGEGRQ